MIVNKQTNDVQKVTNYTMVIGTLLAVNPFFSTEMNIFLFIFLIYLLMVANIRHIKLMDRKIAQILIVTYLLVGVQSIFYGRITIIALAIPLNLFYIPYLLYKMLGVSFFKYYTNILYVIAIYTLPLWFFQSVFPPFDDLLRKAIVQVFPYSWGPEPRSLLFYTPAWIDSLYNHNLGIYRNSGAFHEPGAYSVFLIIGILVNTLFTGKMFDKKNLLFMFCILTTLSTAGYVSMFIILTVFLYKMKTNMFLRISAAVLFVIISFQIFQQEEFLQSKIEAQYADQTLAAQQNMGRVKGQSGRFYAFITSYQEFKENPILGRGIIYATGKKAAGEMHKDSAFGYGFIGLFARFGILFGIFYMINLYKGIKNLGNYSGQSKLVILSSFIAINMVLLTQVFFLSTIVIFIFIIGVYSFKKNKQFIA